MRARFDDSDKRFALITQLYGGLATVHSDCLTMLETLNQGTTAAKNQRGLAKVVRSLRDARIAREVLRSQIRPLVYHSRRRIEIAVRQHSHAPSAHLVGRKGPRQECLHRIRGALVTP